MTEAAKLASGPATVVSTLWPSYSTVTLLKGYALPERFTPVAGAISAVPPPPPDDAGDDGDEDAGAATGVEETSLEVAIELPSASSTRMTK